MADFVSSLLKISNSTVLQQFLHDCVDDLTGAKQASFDRYNSDIEWTLEDFNVARRGIQKIFRESIINNNSSMEDGVVKQEIKKCLDIRQDDIFQSLVKEKLALSGHNLVENFDWRLKWVLGNSSLASMRETLLQVDLQCLNNRIDKKSINFEMDKTALDSLIEQLEEVTSEVKTD